MKQRRRRTFYERHKDVIAELDKGGQLVFDQGKPISISQRQEAFEKKISGLTREDIEKILNELHRRQAPDQVYDSERARRNGLRWQEKMKKHGSWLPTKSSPDTSMDEEIVIDPEKFKELEKREFDDMNSRARDYDLFYKLTVTLEDLREQARLVQQTLQRKIELLDRHPELWEEVAATISD